MGKVELLVGGRLYGGWKSASVTRGIEVAAGSFQVAVSDRWAEESAPWPIRDGDACELRLDGVTVISGYVDQRDIGYGPEEHSLAIAGRDRTSDLIDCSAVLSAWEFTDANALTIARKVAEPFGVPVALQAGALPPAPVAKLAVNRGDKAYEVIDRACRMAGLLAVSDGAGGLVLTRAGLTRAVTELVQGQNVKVATARFDASARFRQYQVTAQHAGSDDWTDGTAAVLGTAEDLGVARAARVLMIAAEGAATAAYAKDRAAWEAAVRAARGDVFTVTVQGWKQGDGTLWPVNALTRYRSEMHGVDSDVLITEATYSVDDRSGTLTQLTLMRPDAFRPEPTLLKPGGTWKEISRGV